MRTNFSPEQLADPRLALVQQTLRTCVHCGLCTATCPTYVLTGDERDSPRGRIAIMQHMLEEGGAPSAEAVHHIDRCLSCLGCRTVCPAGVDYPRLVDTARDYIETHYKRPLRDRFLRAAIAFVMARPFLVKCGLKIARFFAPIATRLPGRIGLMAKKARARSQTDGPREDREPIAPATARRIALMPGCVQQALAPAIDRAAARVLARRGIALETLSNAGCCGALAHHLGRSDEAKAWARRAILAFEKSGAPDAITITATGCAAHLADYGHLFAGDPLWQRRAEAFAARVRDFSALAIPLPAAVARKMRIAYQEPCSLQHGLRQSGRGEAALAAAGFEVVAIPEGHLCCGSAGSYSLLQPDLAQALRRRKLDHIAAVAPDAVASPNIGCLSHLAGPDAPPVVHPAELLDWAEGGPEPQALRQRNYAEAARKIA